MVVGFEGPSHVVNNVATARLNRELSRQQLASAVGISQDTLAYIENGTYTPSLVLALRMSRFLQSPLEDLFALPLGDHPPRRTRAEFLPKVPRRLVLIAIDLGYAFALACALSAELQVVGSGLGWPFSPECRDSCSSPGTA